MRISSLVLWDGDKPREVPKLPVVERAEQSGWNEAKPEYRDICPFYKGQPVIAAPVSDGIKYDPGGAHLPRPTPGEVLAVHPEGRWVMVVFKIGLLQVRECFRPWEVRPRITEQDLDDILADFNRKHRRRTSESGSEGGKCRG